ncbi:MAG: hypothetical protein DMG08_09265 [Acidobacteria bacterium]|nr:MAG: hypothetical protein DMG08_09265 [Acidobacteriota bacterium]
MSLDDIRQHGLPLLYGESAGDVNLSKRVVASANSLLAIEMSPQFSLQAAPAQPRMEFSLQAARVRRGLLALEFPAAWAG